MKEKNPFATWIGMLPKWKARKTPQKKNRDCHQSNENYQFHKRFRVKREQFAVVLLDIWSAAKLNTGVILRLTNKMTNGLHTGYGPKKFKTLLRHLPQLIIDFHELNEPNEYTNKTNITFRILTEIIEFGLATILLSSYSPPIKFSWLPRFELYWQFC